MDAADLPVAGYEVNVFMRVALAQHNLLAHASHSTRSVKLARMIVDLQVV